MSTVQNDNKTNTESAQDQTDLESLSEQELIALMTDAVDNMDIKTFDPADLDKYLDALNKVAPLNIECDVAASKAKFYREHADLINKVFPNEQIPTPPPKRLPFIQRLRNLLKALFRKRR